MAIDLRSSEFANGATIPRSHTCDGDDSSPALEWSGVPEAAGSLAVIMEDPDAPGGTFTHWVLYDLPPDTSSLPAGGPLPRGAKEGRNDFERSGYGGPCPPPGKPHHYTLRLYALDAPVQVAGDAGRAELLAAMQGHVVDQGELTGTFGRGQ